MKKLLLLALTTSLMACTTAAPKQFYRPVGATEQWQIAGRFNQLSYEHNVLINDQTVITGDMPYNGDDASFSGQYLENKVTSDCHWKSKTDLRCLVKVNGEDAANLTF